MDDVPPTQDEPATEVRDHSMDFYRVAALVLVVLGHWVAASLTYRDGSFWRENPLVHLPWTQWLTWMFQVVPVFFVVAGYASAVSWSRHRHSGGAGRQAWLRHRLTKPLGPTAVYVVFALAVLREVDEVHVLTSLAGFEALLRGKPVVYRDARHRCVEPPCARP